MNAGMKKPSNEDEYFARQEFEKRKKILIDQQQAMKEKERAELKERHYMRCPKCGMELIEIDFQGVKIDKCSECQGVYLDDGELEQLMEPEKAGVMKSIIGIFKVSD